MKWLLSQDLPEHLQGSFRLSVVALAEFTNKIDEWELTIVRYLMARFEDFQPVQIACDFVLSVVDSLHLVGPQSCSGKLRGLVVRDSMCRLPIPNPITVPVLQVTVSF